MTRLRALGYGLARALRGALRRPLVTLVSTGAIGVSILLVGVLALAAVNVARLADRWGGGVQMVVYLKDGTTPERARAIGDVLGSVHAIERVDYVPPDVAYHRLAESLGTRQDLLQGVEIGFLPASLEIKLAGGVRDIAAASPIIERLKRTAGVEEVEFLGDWVERLTRLLGALRVAALALALLVGGACVYLIAGTIKLGVYARRDELDVLRLVGATDRFIKLPLLVEGAVQGALGAGIAAGLLYGVFRLAGPALEAMLSGTLGVVHLAFLPTAVLGLAVAGGTLLGMAGSFVAIGRHEV